ncbi:hypothetical protein [Sphingopyxis sp. BSNA05]|uniref:hypothetical protein n=1 Tax=Sphingopyxis sp. BSNA05 TaxID=1236614 RepID=UPI0020B8235C|nr:hypothetical protein [Sphingopyxis sp. BSNA05]
MRASIFLTLAASALAIAGAVHATETSPVTADVAADRTADLETAVTAPGRDAADVALDGSRSPAEVLAFMGLETGDAVLDILPAVAIIAKFWRVRSVRTDRLSRSIRRNLFPASSPRKNGRASLRGSPM